jgi:geranylgeranylglycerol-phosphate geranylgeranyltransferase
MLEKLFAFIRLLRPEISILGIICVYIGAIASGSPYFSNDLLFAMAAVFFIGAGSMPFNDYFDYEIDKINHPNRPLPSGTFKPIFGLYTGIIFFIVGFTLSSLINFFCSVISITAIILICFYELALKNHVFIGNVVVAFTTCISFTFGGAIVGELLKPTFFTLICFFIFLGREIIMDVRDFKGDKINRITLPLKIGQKSSLFFACLLILISIALLFLPVFYNVFMFSDLYVFFAFILAFIAMYSIILLLQDVKNAGKSSDILRVSMALGLILFLLAIIL